MLELQIKIANNNNKGGGEDLKEEVRGLPSKQLHTQWRSNGNKKYPIEITEDIQLLSR